MELTKRQQEILALVGERHFTSIAELAAAVYTSEATVRREVQKLEALGCLSSVYGGVVAREYQKESVPITLRYGENAAKKEQIAAKAAALVKDNSTIIMDSSSTVERMCKHLKERVGLVVVTNNLRVCEELKDSGVRVVCTGGTLLPKHDCFVGAFAEDFIRRINADMLFFSAQGLSRSGEITDASEEEIALRRVMFERSRAQYFLCDTSKIGKSFAFTLCHQSEITDTVFDT